MLSTNDIWLRYFNLSSMRQLEHLSIVGKISVNYLLNITGIFDESLSLSLPSSLKKLKLIGGMKLIVLRVENTKQEDLSNIQKIHLGFFKYLPSSEITRFLANFPNLKSLKLNLLQRVVKLNLKFLVSLERCVVANCSKLSKISVHDPNILDLRYYFFIYKIPYF
jgi:hypothetical protein